jgi:Zn-dependent protease/predicted transcriptional regulator
MPGSLRLGKIAGIEIEVHASWLIIFILLGASLAIGWFPQTLPNRPVTLYAILGAAASLLLFVSVLLHELAHSLVARARGLPVRSITLFIFGGVSNLEREPSSAGVEFVMALVGPLTSLAIGGITLPIGLYLGPTSPVASSLLEYLGASNLLLGAFNLIPGFPLDGGRVLRSAIWQLTGDLQRATRWASRVGQLIAYLFILAGVWLFFIGDVVGGLWIGFIGWFLLNAAIGAYRQVQLAALFGGVTVGEAMNPTPASVPPGLSIQRLVEDYVMPLGLPTMPVAQAGRLVGMIGLDDVRRVPRDHWTITPVSQAMTPVERLRVAHPDQPLEEAYALLTEGGDGQVPVVEDGLLVGMLSRDTILRMLEVRRGLGLREDARSSRERLPRAS